MKIKSNRIHKRRKRITRRAKRNNALRTKNNRKYIQMKGGLGPHDGVNIGLNDKMVFINPAYIKVFEQFIFGSNERAELWKQFFTLCHERGIKVYIITKGIKLGIIRTLHLLKMDDMFKEVLCIRKDHRDHRDHIMKMVMSKFIESNPSNKTGTHDYGDEGSYTTKFAVIREIMLEEGIICEKSNPDSKCEAIFIDDDLENNSAEQETCSNVEVIDAKQNKQSPEYHHDIRDFYSLSSPSSPNYLLHLFLVCGMFTQKMIESINLIPKQRISYMTTRVEEGSCKIIFFDWDGTISALPGAMSLHESIRLEYLNTSERKYNKGQVLIRLEATGGS
jgi:hypothetical protein